MQGGSAQCSGSGGGAHPNADPDWRLYLPPDARQIIVNKIMETLKRHLPVPVPDELSELQRNAVQFEEKIYSVAISKPDYLRKISLRMLSMETKSPPVSNPALPNQEGRSQLGFINPDFTAMQGGSAMCSGSGSVSGSGAGADLNANLDWRFQLQRDARLRIVNKIMDTLKRHLPVSVPDGLSELKEMAVRLEEKIYNAAISQEWG
ncbi:hypothetical protein LUZ61_018564 [Rhynchospora tenuis]|uniref:Mediator complex subunit 15 KIX domain-containing protein n=1 Tax=Rhynchospora tenuis TaxID=198213 RepID=A0AAD6EM20_9POAL|nr:hypothetical protein LUZ61_018564 [Rhynchospora tenuis]